MISKIESGVFEYLASLLETYGIPVEFKYDQDLDLLNEFRKSIRLRIENANTFSKLANNYTHKDESSNLIRNLGLYNRSPINKSPNIGNNINLEVFSRNLKTEYGLEIRNAFFGEVDYSVKIMFDTLELSDIVELVYIYNLANQSKTVSIDYNFGEGLEPVEDVHYNVQFSEILSIGDLINDSNLRYIDFSLKISGLFFLPYYKECSRLETIEVKLHVLNNPSNYEEADETNLIHKSLHTMDKN